MHTNSNPGLITTPGGAQTPWQRDHTRTINFTRAPKILPHFPPLHPAHFVPKKAPIFSTYITDFRTSLFSSLLELSIFCHMTLIAFAVPLFRALSLSGSDDLQLHVSPTVCVRVCVCCKSNKTKKYSPENMKRNVRRDSPFSGKRRARAPTLNLTSHQPESEHDCV